MNEFEKLPDGLPIPLDDGGAQHLVGSTVPAVALPGSDGQLVHLDRVDGRTVLFCYPRTGTPGQPLPTGWDAIPGARGCTPQACGIRDVYNEFTGLGVTVLGLSTQSSEDQAEAAQRLHLPYPLLSDADLELTRAWGLPTFSVDGITLIRRITIFLREGLVEGLIYPVFPPDQSAQAALDWLGEHPVPGRSRPAHPPVMPRRGLPHPIPRPPVR